MKRYIKVPKDIQIVDLTSNMPLFLGPQGGEQKPWVITFKGFVCGTLLKDPRFGKTVAAVISGAGIRTAIEAALSGSGEAVIPLDGEDYELLKNVLEAPESGYNPEVAIQLIPFFRAILDATTTDPRTEPQAA